MTKDVFISLTKEELGLVQDCLGFATAHLSLYAAVVDNDHETANIINRVALAILHKINSYSEEVHNSVFETIVGPVPKDLLESNASVKDIADKITLAMKRVSKAEGEK